MKLDLDYGVVAAVMAAATSTGCSWAHPGANPYRGDPVQALADFAMPEDTRRKLRTMMAAHAYTDVATITRDGIAGHGHYGDLREMHSGHGQMCHGSVDRSAWSAKRKERGLVYCADDMCVIVPTICNNVSLVTRKPEEAPPESQAPIDIEPAAGPPAGGGGGGGGMATPMSIDAPTPGPVGGSTFAQNTTVPSTTPSAPPLYTGIPIGGGIPYGGWPGTPIVGRPIPSIPEPPAAWLMLAGLAWLGARLVHRSVRPAGRVCLSKET